MLAATRHKSGATMLRTVPAPHSKGLLFRGQ
jgi:hypothetical protein